VTSRNDEFDALIDALRSDLPSASDERRVSRRLVAAGVVVATGVVMADTAAAAPVASSSLGLGLIQKLGALPWAAKMGLAGVAGAVAVPATVYLTSTSPPDPLGPTTARSPVVERSPEKPLVEPPKAPALAKSLPDERSTDGERTAPSIEMPSAPRRSVPAGAPKPPGALRALPVEPPASESAESSLLEETELVERALYALKLGDHEGARRALELHASRFPNGLLARERERALARVSSQEEPSQPAAR
jgi:hypothetical protein